MKVFREEILEYQVVPFTLATERHDVYGREKKQRGYAFVRTIIV
jgi:hypothetical protein